MTDNPYLFIINPKSGTSIGKDREEISRGIEIYAKQYSASAQIFFTKERGHATELVRANLNQKKWKAIVAVGGDGTVNEVAKLLVDQATPLGIIPLGSGNGLARHLGLPLTLSAALIRLFQGKIVTIDSAQLNGIPFFCTAGVGFDAYVGHLFSLQRKRGLATYIYVSLKSFLTYKPQRYRLNGKEMKVFSISFANAGQYGNNAWIAPKADVKDGMLDICTIKPFPIWYGMDLTFRMFNKSLKSSAYLSYERAKEAILESDRPPQIHFDGEPLQMDTTRIEIKLKPQSLNVII